MSLLGINFGSQRQAYFQVRVTIHELTNVPMVAGQFKAKWRVDHTQNLSSVIAAASAGPSTVSVSTEEGPGRQHLGAEGKAERMLHHKKSTSTLNSQKTQGEREENGSVGSGSVRRANKDRDDTSSTYSGKQTRKGGHSFLSNLRDAFHSPSSRNHQGHTEQELAGSLDKARTSIDQNGTKKHANPAHEGEQTHDQTATEVKERTGHKRDSQNLGAASHQDREEKPGGNAQHHSLPGYEPRGETASARVKDNRVVWERQLDVGVRIGIEKPRQVSGGSHSSAAEQSTRGVTAMRRSTSGRDVNSGILVHDSDRDRRDHTGVSSTPRERDFNPSGWAQLGQSELRISIKAEVPTGTESNNAGHLTTLRMGHIAVNLAEFAPYPHVHHHHHHHAISTHHRPGHTHSEHHHHHHHHQVLTRSETRRYLLLDGPTNATVKLTVEMTHVGGSREYVVPANKRGLLANTAASMTEGSPPGSKGPSSSVGSDAGSVGEGGGGSSSDHNDPQARKGQSGMLSGTSSMARAFAEWHPHHVARHSRIPANNLNTTLSHKDTARAVKEAGTGGRLAFSFAAGAHHDRPPEDVIDSLFDPTADHSALLLTPSSSRDRKLGRTRSSTTREEDKFTTDGKANDDNRGTPRSREMAQSPSNEGRDAIPARPKLFGKHTRQSSTGSHGLKGFFHTTSHPSSHPGPQQHPAEMASYDSALQAKKHGMSASNTSSSKGSSRASGIRWDPSVVAGNGTGQQKNRGDGPSDSARESDTNPLPGTEAVGHGDVVLSSSPKGIPSNLDDDNKQGSSSIRLASSEENDARLSTDDSLPPKTPPDVARRDTLSALDKHQFHLAPPVDISPPWEDGSQHLVGQDHPQESLHMPTAIAKKPSRRTLGLTRDAALKAGYRGAGWGTLDVSRHLSHASIDSADDSAGSGSELSHGPKYAYLVDRTSSPSPLHQTAAH